MSAMVVVVVVCAEVCVARRRGRCTGDGGGARVTDGSGQGGERRVLLVRVVRMLMGTLRPCARRHGESAYWGEGGAIVAVGVVVGLGRSLATSGWEGTTGMVGVLVVVVVEVEVSWRRRGRGRGRGGIHVFVLWWTSRAI